MKEFNKTNKGVIIMKNDYKIAQCGDIIPNDWEWYDDYDNWCEICYEPITECLLVCYCCANNRVEDGIWTEEEKDKKAFVDGIRPKGFQYF